jgi:hypothetical protein
MHVLLSAPGLVCNCIYNIRMGLQEGVYTTVHLLGEPLNREIEGTKCHLERQRPTLCTTSNAGHFRLSRQQQSGQGRVVSTCVAKRCQIQLVGHTSENCKSWASTGKSCARSPCSPTPQ